MSTEDIEKYKIAFEREVISYDLYKKERQNAFKYAGKGAHPLNEASEAEIQDVKNLSQYLFSNLIHANIRRKKRNLSMSLSTKRLSFDLSKNKNKNNQLLNSEGNLNIKRLDKLFGNLGLLDMFMKDAENKVYSDNRKISVSKQNLDQMVAVFKSVSESKTNQISDRFKPQKNHLFTLFSIFSSTIFW